MTKVGRLKLIFLAILVSVLYFKTFVWLGQVYRTDPENSHGFLIPLVLGYLIWSKRDVLKMAKSRPASWGVVLIVLAILLQILSFRAGVYITSVLSFIILVTGLILYLMGSELLKKLSFPVLYMFFLVPLPGLVQAILTFPMKIFASKVSAGILGAMGTPVLREGNVLVMPEYSFEVADACSGLRSMMALLALGALFAYFTQHTIFRKLLLFLLSVPIAIAANIFRIVVTCLIAYYVSTSIVEGFLHEFSGILVFMSAVVLLMATSKLMKLKVSGAKT
ncbi:MAG: exosortase [Candidatus Hydrothermarchaeota archaeon]|nr:MAG: exosortase [Candidatus Hydrothermarchaeota archaeon]